MRVQMFLITGLIALAVAGGSQAQAQMDPFDYHAANVRLLMSKPIQKELALTEAQRTKMNKHADYHKIRVQQFGEKLQKSGKDPNPVDPEFLAIMETLKKNVLAELNPKQLRRLRELSLQQVGLVAVLDDKVAAKLGINGSQLKQIRDLYTAGSNEARELVKKEVGAALAEFKNVKPKTDAEKKSVESKAQQKVAGVEKRLEPQVNKIRANTRDKMLAVLTTEQKTSFKALQGKPFNSSA
jgi:hypothetical protein